MRCLLPIARDGSISYAARTVAFSRTPDAKLHRGIVSGWRRMRRANLRASIGFANKNPCTISNPNSSQP
jgi:hypothetical protein